MSKYLYVILEDNEVRSIYDSIEKAIEARKEEIDLESEVGLNYTRTIERVHINRNINPGSVCIWPEEYNEKFNKDGDMSIFDKVIEKEKLFIIQ